MDEIFSHHAAEYGEEPEVIAEAPGVVNLMGEHTDFHEGYVLQIGLHLSVKVAISKRNDTSLRFYSVDLNERKRTTIANLKYKREDRWANYLKGVLYEIMQLGSSFKGMNISIMGVIPKEVGLGSSAALGIATALATREAFLLDLQDIQLVQLAYLSETAFIGKREKITDQLTTFYSREGSAVFIDLRSLEFQFIPFSFRDLIFVLTESGVKQTGIQEELEERYEICNDSVELLRERDQQKSLRDLTRQDLRAGMGLLPESSRRLCTHVVQENERVTEAMQLLKSGDGPAFGKLMHRSHESLRDNFEVSCPEVDWLVKRAMEVDGCYGSRLIGPGFGGCTLTLCHKDALPDYQKRLDEYEHIFGFHPVYYIISPQKGAHIVYSE
ncbi:MAG: galactokinase [Spirochaetaceae bacterium]|nr:galactokinase [Spirochaetaceae bacterium]MCF7946986.1 galactokinase [Spirochaetia bacterium]MCF7950193.1 galactokinase [Spirochaetaceae bacterium]